jgi:hypothetical protein
VATTHRRQHPGGSTRLQAQACRAIAGPAVRIKVIWVKGANRCHIGVSRPDINDSRSRGEAENDAGSDAARTKSSRSPQTLPHSVQDASEGSVRQGLRMGPDWAPPLATARCGSGIRPPALPATLSPATPTECRCWRSLRMGPGWRPPTDAGELRIWDLVNGAALTSLRVADDLFHLRLTSTTIAAAGEHGLYFLRLSATSPIRIRSAPLSSGFG